MPDRIISKACTSCGTEKAFAEFYKRSASKDGLMPICKACSSAKTASWRLENSERNKSVKSAWESASKAKRRSAKEAFLEANKDRLAAEKDARAKARKAKKLTQATNWQAANPDRRKAITAAYRAANPQKTKAAVAASVAAKPEKYKAMMAAYRAANRDAYRVHKQNRRVKESSSGVLSKGLASRLFMLQQGKCPCCKQPLGDDYHLDHKMPLALGGENTDDNMQLLRATCNLQKHAKHPVDFMQSRGFLL